jgi:hypothetical protein
MLPDTYIPLSEDPNVQTESDSHFLRFNKALEANETLVLRLAGNYRSGHSAFGYFYFDLENPPRPHHSPEFPTDYEDKIGFSFDAKRKAKAQGRELDIRRDERDTPKRFAALTAIYHKCPSDPNAAQSYANGKVVIADFTQPSLLELIDTLFHEEEYAIEDGQLAGYVIKVTKTVKNGKTSYKAVSLTKRVSKEEQALWDAEGAGIYVPAIFTGADPFEGKPADGDDSLGQPPARAAARDGLGADSEWD